jgi:hypothetical protein
MIFLVHTVEEVEKTHYNINMLECIRDVKKSTVS